MCRILTLLLVPAFLGCGTAPPPPPLVLGHVATLSGPDRRAGEQASLGIRLALDELNKDTSKRPIVVRHADTQGKLEAFESQAVRLATLNRVVGLIGGNTAEEVLRLDRARAQGPAGESAYLPIFSASGWRSPGMSDQVFFLGMTPYDQGKALARLAFEDLKVPQIALLVDETQEQARTLAQVFTQEFTDLQRAKAPKDEAATPALVLFGKDAKMREILDRIPPETPAVLLAGNRVDLRNLVEALPMPRPLLLYAGDDGVPAPGEFDGGPLYLASAFALDKNVDDFAQKFRQAFKEEPDVHAALAYEATRLLADALRRPTGLEPFRDELLKAKDLPLLTGPTAFNSRQILQRPIFLLKLEGARLSLLRKEANSIRSN